MFAGFEAHRFAEHHRFIAQIMPVAARAIYFYG